MTRRGALAMLGTSLLAFGAPRITGLRRATYRVSNLDRALAYWTGILGFPAVAGVDGETLLQINERQFVGLVPGWDGVSDRFVAFAFEASGACGATADPYRHVFRCETPPTAPASSSWNLAWQPDACGPRMGP